MELYIREMNKNNVKGLTRARLQSANQIYPSVTKNTSTAKLGNQALPYVTI